VARVILVQAEWTGRGRRRRRRRNRKKMKVGELMGD